MKVFERVLEGEPVSKAMVAEGYSPHTAKTPSKLTNTPAWLELVETYLDDTKLAEKHDLLLNAALLTKVPFEPDDTDDEIKNIIEAIPGQKLIRIKEQLDKEGFLLARVAYVKSPDTQTQYKALDGAYKIKGNYAPDKSVNLNLTQVVGNMSEEHKQLKEEYEEKLRDSLNESI